MVPQERFGGITMSSINRKIKRKKEKLFAERCNLAISENFDGVPVKLKRILTDNDMKNRKLLLEELLEQEYGNTNKSTKMVSAE